MAACWRKPLTWLAAAWFAAVAFGGQAVHLLPGLGHGIAPASHCLSAACSRPPACSHAHPTCCNHAHHACPGERPRHASSGFVRRVDVLPDGHACPICQFFAQAKTPAVEVCSEQAAVVLPGRPMFAEPRLDDAFFASYRSRAPPFAL